MTESKLKNLDHPANVSEVIVQSGIEDKIIHGRQEGRESRKKWVVIFFVKNRITTTREVI